jgi:hypothetical protein
VGSRRTVELNIFSSDWTFPRGTFLAEIIGYTKAHARAPAGNAVETWRNHEYTIHTIHSGEAENPSSAMMVWLKDGEVKYANLMRQLENSYAVAYIRHSKADVLYAQSAIFNVLEQHLSSIIMA